MGTTWAALHLGCDDGPEIRDLAVRAFKAIGWEHVESPASEQPTRHVAVSIQADPPVATVVISGNDEIDDGTLKELAVAMTRVTEAPAVVTEINDGDAFNVVLFRQGRQMDALGDAVAHTENDLRTLPADARALAWSEAFGRDLGPAPGGGSEQLAEEEFGAVLSWIGLDPGKAPLSYDETVAMSCGEAGTLLLTFAPSDPPESIGQASNKPTLSVYHDDDDCPHHRVYPAHWTLAAHEASGLKWLIESRGAGFDGARVEFQVDDADGGAIRLTHISMHAFPFFNGQIVSATPVAVHEEALSVVLEDGVISYDAIPFSMPHLDHEAAKRLVIVLRLECVPEDGARARIRPRFHSVGPHPSPLDLPPVRLLGGNASWRPAGISGRGSDGPYEERLLLELNTPSVLSVFAIMDGDSEGLRRSAQAAAESWLAGLSDLPGSTASVLTKKHMTASGNITKKKADFLTSELTSERAWPRWFSAKTDLQTLRIDIRPDSAFQPYSGFVMKSALRDDAMTEEVGPEPDPALHIAFWAIDHPEAWSTLGWERSAWLERVGGWIEANKVLQAHQLCSAWIPDFDDYEDFAQTIYEDLSGVDWFRKGLKGSMMTRRWCSKTLRSASPRMWLCDGLVASLPNQAHSLEPIADISRVGDLWRISLKQAASIAALERSISTILPRAH